MAPQKKVTLDDIPTSKSCNATQMRMVESLRIILPRQYFKQLNLDYVTVTDPNSKVFLEDVDVYEIDTRSKKEALIYLKEHRFDNYIHFINNFVASNRFVGPIMQSILEMILTVNQKYDETSNTTVLRIQSASLLFEKIINNFPPSWPTCSDCYKKLMHSKFDIEIDLKKIRVNSSHGLFPIILALLEGALKEDEEVHSQGSAFDSMMNFQQYEKIENEKSSYSKLPRDDKIDRLFIVLNLLVKLMEIDLSIWINRHPFQTINIMSNAKTCPLIAHMLWMGRDTGAMNPIIRDILRVFTMSIWIDFPDEKIDILARLVNLVATAVNLCENFDKESLITYPNIKSLNESFASEVIKSIEGFPYTVEYYINVINKIRSPIIRMLVSTRILNKFNRGFEKVTMKKIVDEIANKSWMDYEERVGDVSIRDNIDTSDNYPTYEPMKNVKKTKKSSKYLEINRDEYLNLLLHLFESYVQTYRTHELLEQLLHTDDPTVESTNNDTYKQAHTKIAIEKNHQIDFEKLLKDWNELSDVVNKFASTDVILFPKLLECRNLYVCPPLCQRYQDDMEHIVRLKDLIEMLNDNFGETFQNWHKTINQYLSGCNES